MKKNTPKDYKEAVRIKFEKEKDGIYSTHLSNPSQASLRDLCWKIFKSNPETDDLTVYEDFFKFPFDSKDENTSITYTNKFKKVGAFLRGGIEPAKIDTVNFAAILVDYQPRPFRKFKERGVIVIDQPIGSPKIPFAFGINDKREEEIEIERNEIEKENGNYQEEQLANSGNEETFTYDGEKEIEEMKSKTQVLVDVDENQQNKSPIKVIYAIIGVTLFLCLIGIYYKLSYKECMQWSGDHYEMVDCDLKIQGFGTAANIEIFDPTLVNLRKVKVCDTTTCFDKNGVATIWYAKRGNEVDFFNAHGRHPENNHPLRPVTPYILNKYVRK